jgi:uncharacterized protein YggL (DUF469 family)
MKSITTQQKEFVRTWLGKNISDFKVGELVDVWERK